MTSLRYTWPWCAVKGDQSWNFATEAEAEAWAGRVSHGEQVDIYEWVDVAPDGKWVWRSSQLTTVCKPEEAA